ncbi:MAG: ribbon-helix-helix protein, CopG family [Candidatus Thermoplasmatota archaeon]|nr:ribbon-helix-helix protein, CopG family [Candidatus Thermoplasmatota archaeon]
MKRVGHQLNVYLTEQQIERLKEEKDKTGCSMGSLVRMAVNKFLEIQ